MIKLLVVDDDSIIRTTFRNIINWEEHDFSLCSTACNGQEALETVRREHVDIVITDIKMPIMDGLSFIETVKKEFPDIKIIVLSAFDDFSLVNKAYKLGASEYLLKMELEAEAVLNLLKKLSLEIQKNNELKKLQNKREEMLFHMENTFEQTKQFLQQKVLKELIYSSYSAGLSEKLQRNKIDISPLSALLLVIKLNNYYSVEKETFSGGRELLQYGVSNVFEELLREQGEDIYYFGNSPDEYVVIFQDFSTPSEAHKLQACACIFSNLQCSMEKCFNIHISGGLSNIVQDENMFKLAYQRAASACEYTFVTGRTQLLNYEDIDLNLSERTIEINKKIILLSDALKSMDEEKILSIIPDMQICGEDVTVNNLNRVKDFFNFCYYEILNSLKEYNLDRSVIELLDQYGEYLCECGSLTELNEWLAKVLGSFLGDIAGNKVINKAKNFLKKHYAEQIRLADLAEYMHISESHLSRIFKKNIGMSFTQYIINIRIEAAISLMNDTNLKVYEIAERVGYQNVEHFSRIFKNITGKSPKEYMK